MFLKDNSLFSWFFWGGACSTENKGLYSLTIIKKFKHKRVFASSSRSSTVAHNLSLQASSPHFVNNVYELHAQINQEKIFKLKKSGSLHLKNVGFHLH